MVRQKVIQHWLGIEKFLVLHFWRTREEPDPVFFVIVVDFVGVVDLCVPVPLLPLLFRLLLHFRHPLQAILDNEGTSHLLENLDPDTDYDVTVTAIYPDESESEDLLGSQRTCKHYRPISRRCCCRRLAQSVSCWWWWKGQKG